MTKIPQKIAQKIIHELGINEAPIDIKAVIDNVSKKYAISVRLERHNFIDKVSGAHIRKGEKHMIVYNKEQHPHRQRFTIAHELGHLLLEHANLRNNEDDFNTRNPEETAANKFAAELLVPFEFLKKDFREGVRDVKSLAQKYQVSEEMMWWRMMDTQLFKKI